MQDASRRPRWPFNGCLSVQVRISIRIISRFSHHPPIVSSQWCPCPSSTCPPVRCYSIAVWHDIHAIRPTCLPVFTRPHSTITLIGYFCATRGLIKTELIPLTRSLPSLDINLLDIFRWEVALNLKFRARNDTLPRISLVRPTNYVSTSLRATTGWLATCVSSISRSSELIPVMAILRQLQYGQE